MSKRKHESVGPRIKGFIIPKEGFDEYTLEEFITKQFVEHFDKDFGKINVNVRRYPGGFSADVFVLKKKDAMRDFGLELESYLQEKGVPITILVVSWSRPGEKAKSR
jgi:hypothetical protein